MKAKLLLFLEVVIAPTVFLLLVVFAVIFLAHTRKPVWHGNLPYCGSEPAIADEHAIDSRYDVAVCPDKQ